MFDRDLENTTLPKTRPSELSPESRRSFLGLLLGLGSVLVSALLSVPLIRFSLFPLLRRTTELKRSPVGELSEFSSLTEPVMRTIQIGQVDGWRKTVRRNRLCDERQSGPASRSYVHLSSPGLYCSMEQAKKTVRLPLPQHNLCGGWNSYQRAFAAGDGYARNIG